MTCDDTTRRGGRFRALRAFIATSVLNFIAFWMLQIPLAYWLASSSGLGPDGVFIAIVVSESVLTVMSVLVFRRGKWRLQQV